MSQQTTSIKYHLNKTELIGLEPIQDLIELTIWSAYVKHERIVSLLILAEPESGKTELMKKYRKNNGIYVRRRFSAFGLTHELKKHKVGLLFEKPKILGHIFIYDYASIFSYKSNTVDSTIGFLDALIEEGLSPESSYWIAGDELKEFEGLKCGIIAGINSYGFFTTTGKVKANLYKGGWLSRNIVVSFDISETMVTKIFDSIQHGDYRFGKKFVPRILLKLSSKRTTVDLPEKYARDISDLARELGEGYSEDFGNKLRGFRLHKSLISLVKASALREGRTMVNDEDVERLHYLSNWMNLKMNKLKLDYPFN